MTDFITEVKKLMDETGNAVSQLRQNQEQAIAEFKKHGETLGETKTKQDLIEKDIAGLILSVQEIKKAQSVNNSQPKDGLMNGCKQQILAACAYFGNMTGTSRLAKPYPCMKMIKVWLLRVNYY